MYPDDTRVIDRTKRGHTGSDSGAWRGGGGGYVLRKIGRNHLWFFLWASAWRKTRIFFLSRWPTIPTCTSRRPIRPVVPPSPLNFNPPPPPPPTYTYARVSLSLGPCIMSRVLLGTSKQVGKLSHILAKCVDDYFAENPIEDDEFAQVR